MSLVSSARLTQMRARVAQTLPGTAVIAQLTPTDDGGGDWSESFTPVNGGTVACRLDPLGRQITARMVAEQEALKVRYQLTVPYDAPLDTGYRVTIDSENYEIIELDRDHHWNVARRAIVSRVDS